MKKSISLIMAIAMIITSLTTQATAAIIPSETVYDTHTDPNPSLEAEADTPLFSEAQADASIAGHRSIQQESLQFLANTTVINDPSLYSDVSAGTKSAYRKLDTSILFGDTNTDIVITPPEIFCAAEDYAALPGDLTAEQGSTFFSSGSTYNNLPDNVYSYIDSSGQRVNFTLSNGVVTFTAGGIIENSPLLQYASQITKIIVDGSIQIGSLAFYGMNNLKSITINAEIQTIGSGAFSACSSLESIKFPSTLQRIDHEAFRNCTSIKSIHFPEKLEVIGKFAFAGCSSLQSVTFPAALKTVDDYAFWLCTSLTDVLIPSAIEFGAAAFAECTSLEHFNMPSNLEKIGADTFNGCTNLKQIGFSEILEVIPAGTFYRCISLESVVIPDTVAAIEETAFYECQELKTITFPEGYTEIEVTVTLGIK